MTIKDSIDQASEHQLRKYKRVFFLDRAKYADEIAIIQEKLDIIDKQHAIAEAL